MAIELPVLDQYQKAKYFFDQIEKAHASNELYSKVARYFIESGWMDRAKRVLFHALQVYPQDERVRKLLAECNG